MLSLRSSSIRLILDSFKPTTGVSWWVRKDVNALIALLSDNLSTVLTYIVIVQSIFDKDIIYGRIIPGTGLALLWGNLWYLILTRVTGMQKKRSDMTSLPYGVNTPGMFAFAFSITINMIRDNKSHDNIMKAYYTTVAANLICGIIIVCISPFCYLIQKYTPRVALLSSISGIGIAYLTVQNVVTAMSEPMVGFISILIVMVGMYSLRVSGQVGPIPITIVAVLWGSSVCWIQGGCSSGNETSQTIEAVKTSFDSVKWYGLTFPVEQVFSHIGEAGRHIGIIIPIALQMLTGTITAVELAKNAGDDYNVVVAMFGDGMGTIISAFAGCPLGMTTYPNHPGYKQLGGQSGYSWAMGILYFILSLFGILSPFLAIFSIHSIVPSIIFVGIMIVSETLSICKREHYLCFVFGVIPSLVDWAKAGSSDATYLTSGNLVIGLIWSAILYYMIERSFVKASIWSGIGAILSFFGLIHSSLVGIHVSKDDMGWRFAVAYLQGVVLFILCHFVQKKEFIAQANEAEEDSESLVAVVQGLNSAISPTLRNNYEAAVSPCAQLKGKDIA